MNDKPYKIPVSKLDNPDMQGAPIALVRAARRAREIAVRTGTPLIIWEDGKLVEKYIDPSELDSPDFP